MTLSTAQTTTVHSRRWASLRVTNSAIYASVGLAAQELVVIRRVRQRDLEEDRLRVVGPRVARALLVRHLGEDDEVRVERDVHPRLAADLLDAVRGLARRQPERLGIVVRPAQVERAVPGVAREGDDDRPARVEERVDQEVALDHRPALGIRLDDRHLARLEPDLLHLEEGLELELPLLADLRRDEPQAGDDALLAAEV